MVAMTVGAFFIFAGLVIRLGSFFVTAGLFISLVVFAIGRFLVVSDLTPSMLLWATTAVCLIGAVPTTWAVSFRSSSWPDRKPARGGSYRLNALFVILGTHFFWSSLPALSFRASGSGK